MVLVPYSVRIVVIEGERELERILKLAGYDATAISNEDEALELEQKGIDLLIAALDPEEPARERALRTLMLRCPNMPIIVSNHDAHALASDLRDDPSLRHLHGPVGKKALLALVNQTLEESEGMNASECIVTEDEDGEGWLELTAPSSQEYLDRFQEFCESLVKTRLDDVACNELKIAVKELGQNAIEWGNRLEANRKIRMAYCLKEDRIVVRIADEGPGFNPEKVPDPTNDPMAIIEAREATGKRPGGFGIHLARKTMDDIRYNERGNVVVMEKLFRPVITAPLFLKPRMFPKRWGDGSLLPDFGFEDPGDPEAGELWLASDIEGKENLVEDDPEGRHLGQLMAIAADEILGGDTPRGTPFPLIVKFIMAGKKLSIQVHPNAEAARRLEVADRGKHEAWWIVGARESACIYRGLKQPCSKEQAVAALEQGRFHELLRLHKPEIDELYDIAPGTVHASGDGLLLLEVQERCDITFRFDDWGNPGTTLHRERALEVSNLSGSVHDAFVDGDRPDEPQPFVMEKLELQAGESLAVGQQEFLEIYVLVRGELELSFQEADEACEKRLKSADTFLWPARLPAGVIQSPSGAVLLRTFPRLR